MLFKCLIISSYLLSLCATVAAQESVVLKCLKRTEEAGTPIGDSFDDKYKVRNTFKTDDLMTWGFQYCTNPSTGILSSFRIYLADNYGQGDYISMTAAGPGVTNCRRIKFTDTLKKVEFHVQDVIMGVTLTVGEKVKSFGKSDNYRDSEIFRFDESI